MAVGGTLWVRYYGREHLGKIRGIVTTFGAGLSGFGPFLVDGLAQAFGSYRQILLALAIAPLPIRGSGEACDGALSSRAECKTSSD